MYVAVPKAACSTVLAVLQWIEVNGDASQIPDDPHDKSRSPLVGPFADIALFNEAIKSDRFVRFSFVRNPYTRLLSCYLDKVCGRQEVRRIYLRKLGHDESDTVTFRQFLEAIRDQHRRDMDVHWAPQSFLLNPEQIRYEFLGRVENLSADLHHLASVTKVRTPNLPARARAHATGARQRLAEFFGPREESLVQDIYADDFEKLAYPCKLPLSN